VIIRKTAGREDYGAQLGGTTATTVVEVHKRKAGPGHGILQQRDRRCLRQAMLTAQMQNGADKAMAAVVVITAARPVAIVGKNSSMRSSNCSAFATSASGIGLLPSDPGLQTHGITGRPNLHRGRVSRAIFGARSAQSLGGPKVRLRLPPATSPLRTRRPGVVIPPLNRWRWPCSPT
jgi:hypothetical protein